MGAEPRLLLDTGPLVALLNRRDRYHDWARQVLADSRPPLLSCEAVLSEACHLLLRAGQPAGSVLRLIERGVIEPAFELREQYQAVAGLLHKYRDQPMSLADACLVRMTELHTTARVLTLDSDFRVYRRFSRQTVPVLMPGTD